MNNIQRLTNIPLLCGFLLVALCLSQPAMAGDKAVTNEDVYKLLNESSGFKKSHSVMSRQQEKLTAILDGFLTGDTGNIGKESDEFLNDMRQLLQTYPPDEKSETGAWKSTAKIVEEMHLMKEEISKNDYNKAYEHFANITASCIQCHQAARQWGKFPQPAAPPPAKDDTSPDHEEKKALPVSSPIKSQP
ncbi:MAG: hypothetical protein HZC18_03975 [Candidatus Omnitrophica bacterium]|nr:hypothetical protein [Candidatus Omnitrophota bacterium]